MTNPTPQDREMAEKLAQLLEEYDPACDCDDCNYIRTHDLLTIQKVITTARLQGRREGLEEAAKALEADAQLCDCHAYDEGECACGAWCEWKTVPMHRAVEIVRTLYGAEPDKDGEA